ncbi:FGGY-family pentulose kinase [Trueperella bonasi]|uniref:FGGY-family pentulose kinase n=1 Tax=Trueperella bonasi TaxID=312286 RepID=A0ABT9NGT1_9ACTO|nr:FGGY family carbohydrate kinase [Trueperella bonasi]MDP9806606.1 FGGY-family pentulose kinase [Trueperella bonasi]
MTKKAVNFRYTHGPYLMGIDFGTESCRVGIFDPVGSPLAFAATPYKTTYPHPGWAEQDPEDWKQALVASTRKVMARAGIEPPEIAGISYDATTMTVVPVDENGDHLSNAIMWMDVRATEQAARVVESQSPATRYTGGGTLPPTAEWFPFKAAWLRENEPELYKKAYRLVDAPDWLTYQLTGRWTVNINTAAHRAYYDRDNGGWPVDLYEEAGAGDVFDKIPEDVVDLGVHIGGLTKWAAEALGLLPGTPVAQGGGDAWHGQIGLNALSPGKMSLVTGSSHVMSGQADQPVSGPGFFGGYTDGVVPGQYTVEASLTSSGSVLKWFKDQFCQDIEKGANELGISAYDVLNQRSREIPIGCEGLIINEYFQGNRTPWSDAKARGVFTGLALGHTREHMYRAIQEAVCYGVEASMRKLKEAGFEVEQFVAAGGATKSRDWIQMHSDVTGIPIVMTEVGDAVTLGSCILAATGAGMYDSMQEAADAMVHEREHIEPNMAAHEEYKFYADKYVEQYALNQDHIHAVVDHVSARRK